MATLNLDASVQLEFEIGENRNVFDILKENGVDPAKDLVAVQELPNRLYDVTFKSDSLRRKFYPVLLSGRGYTAKAYSSSAILVTVLHVPHELEDNKVRYVLSKYGQVISGRYYTYRDYPEVYNGITLSFRLCKILHKLCGSYSKQWLCKILPNLCKILHNFTQVG